MMLETTDTQEKVQGFMVWKMDRVHRNQLNLLKLIKVELAEMNIDFINITESIVLAIKISCSLFG
ncbi:hypothetical protein C4A77_06005 [Brevibacillus laterosporus]|uniref:Resolvase/invertase-type recombinase catalytic domain-containing protein n=1 Tax=Brevibacillus laterosporus TaxID=1465 RepID=A0AAP8QF90_BRELA|nr:hypothetical protein [Brevibacillus laterosporus]PPB08838.1 hypothetical protein C4A77_06005 [Brevibacillus laterosporus]